MSELVFLGMQSVLLIACVGTLGIGHVLEWGRAIKRYRQAQHDLALHIERHGNQPYVL